MNLFFEEDGAFKVGTEMSGTDSACQVELPTGKRIKVKRSHIFVTYNSPSPAEFLARAQQEAEEIDLEFSGNSRPMTSSTLKPLQPNISETALHRSSRQQRFFVCIPILFISTEKAAANIARRLRRH